MTKVSQKFEELLVKTFSQRHLNIVNIKGDKSEKLLQTEMQS